MSVYNLKTLTIGNDTYTVKQDDATQFSSGSMSAADKEKLDGIAYGATANTDTATTTTDGLMSAADKIAIDSLTAITNNEINSIFSAI